MKIIRANHLGMCFGVRDAIDLAKRTAAKTPVTVLGQLVHNEHVLNDLKEHGIRFANNLADARTATVLVTAHGASDKRLNAARSAGHQVVEATCPLVHQAHRELRMLLMADYHPVIIGKPDHVEVLGMTEDLESFDVIETREDTDKLTSHPKLGIVAQTTQPIDRVNDLVTLIRGKFPESDVLFMDTVCRPTKDRQFAAIDLAKQCSVVIVIGGNNSNNTHELVATCSKFCDRVHHVTSANELKGSWFSKEDTVGLTAGTSTPEWIVESVETTLKELDPSPERDNPSPNATPPDSVPLAVRKPHQHSPEQDALVAMS